MNLYDTLHAPSPNAWHALVRRALTTTVLSVLLWMVGCQPPMRVNQFGSVVIINLQQLGEYGSDVGQVRVAESPAGRVVWEMQGRNGPQLGVLSLHVGANPTIPKDTRHGDYDVVVPAGEATFRLEAGITYTIDVWRHVGASSGGRRSSFRLKPD
jgi:hypothetical protein